MKKLLLEVIMPPTLATRIRTIKWLFEKGLGQLLNNKADYSGEVFNFGPKAIQNSTVEQLINDLTLLG